MSDKYKGFIVSFESDLSEDGMNRLKDSIFLTKGVLSIAPLESDVANDFITKQRVKHDLIPIVVKAINDVLK